MYKASSPYYQAILARCGRNLAPDTVRTILAEHGVEESDYLGDPYVALGALPETTDAAELLAWLGY